MNAAAGQQLPGLSFGEGQLTGADVGQFPGDPAPLQSQWWVGTGRQDDAQRRRLMIQQSLERSQDTAVDDQVEIVQYQNHRPGQCREPGADQPGRVDIKS